MENREKRILLGDKTIDDLVSVLAAIKKSFEDIIIATDLESTRKLATDASAALKAFDRRFESLKSESTSLRNEAHELAQGHRTTRQDT